MLRGGRAHPSRIKAPGRIGHAIIPILFQLCQTDSLILQIAAWHRHVTSGLVGMPCRNARPARTIRTAQRAAPTRKNRQGYSEETKCESEQNSAIEKRGLRSGFLFHGQFGLEEA